MKNGLLCSLLALLVQPSWGAIQNISASGGDVEFLAIGRPSFIKIHGTGGAPTGKLTLDGSTVVGQFEFDLTSLVTGIETRDEHMKKKYLEVEKYPKASLDLKGATPIASWSVANPKLADAQFNGVLTLHGVSKPVAGNFNVSSDGKADVTFHVKLSDFSVTIPTFAGITVADDVEVKVVINKLQ